MKIYIAGKYSDTDSRKVQANVNEAIEAGCLLIKKGHIPHIPHLSHYIWLHPDGDFPYEKWCELDIEWLKVCDGFLLLSHSKGADKELEYAEKLGLKIFHSLFEVPIVKKII